MENFSAAAARLFVQHPRRCSLRAGNSSTRRSAAFMRLATPLLLLAAALYRCSGAPLIIAHRGSPCDFPEETLPGFQKAIDDGADYIEMDVVRTKDGHLICRHDLTLDSSTDIAQRPEFADRRSWRVMPDGSNRTGWFAADLTLEEVRTLAAVQTMPFRDHSLDGMYSIPTFEEVLHLALDSLSAGKPVGMYVEAKEPVFHQEVGLPLESHLVQALMDAGVNQAGLKVILQSFDIQSLRTMRALLVDNGGGGNGPGSGDGGGGGGGSTGVGEVPLVLLMGCDANVTEADLDDLAAAGIAGIGPHKNLLAPVEEAPECNMGGDTCSFDQQQQCAGRLKWGAAAAAAAVSSGAAPEGSSSSSSSSEASGAGVGVEAEERPLLLEWAKMRSLVVHAFTFRNEYLFMPLDFRGDPHAELELFGAPDKGISVDGVFVDCAATAVRWKRSLPPPKPHEIVEQEQAILEEEQQPAPTWVIFVVVITMVGLTLGSAVYVARWLMQKRADRSAGLGMPSYQALDLGMEGPDHDDIELPVSRRATPGISQGPEPPPVVITKEH